MLGERGRRSRWYEGGGLLFSLQNRFDLGSLNDAIEVFEDTDCIPDLTCSLGRVREVRKNLWVLFKEFDLFFMELVAPAAILGKLFVLIDKLIDDVPDPAHVNSSIQWLLA